MADGLTGGSDGRDSTGERPVRILVYGADLEWATRLAARLEDTEEPLSVESTAGREDVEGRIGDDVDCLVCGNTVLDQEAGVLESVRSSSSTVPVVCCLRDGDLDPEDALEAAVADVVETPLESGRMTVLARRLRTLGAQYRQCRRGASYRSIFEELPDAVVVHDEEGNYVEMNRAVTELLGYDRADLFDHSVDEIETALDSDELEASLSSLDPGESKTAEGRNRRADGTDIPVRVSLRRLEGADDHLILATIRDLTELKDRERDLERGMDLLKRTEALANAGGWELDVETETLRWTHGAKRIYGVDDDYEPTIEDALEFYHPDDRSVVREAIDRAVEDGEPFDDTLRLVTADGVTRRVRARGEPAVEDGRTVRVRGALWDVTEREKRRRTIEASNAKLEALAEAFPDVAMVVDDAHRYLEVFAGSEAESLLAAPPTELVGDSIDDHLPSDPAAQLTDAIDTALETDSVTTVEYTLEVPAGERWFESRVAPVDGVIDGSRAAVVVARDVTDQRQTLEELRTREAHLTQAQAVANLGSWYKDIPSDVIHWSDEVYEIFGAEVVDGPIDHGVFMNYVHPDDRDFVDRRWEAAKRGEPYELEHRIVTDDGETRWVRQNAELEFDGGEPTGAIGVVQDVTDRKEYERRLETQNEQLDVLNRLIRHDMRNQMNVIDGYAAILEERLPKAKPVALQIRSVADDLISVTEDIRAANRLIRDGEESRPVRIRRVVDDAIESVCDDFPEFECRCTVEVDADLWITGSDAVQLAVENVIENAIEHNDAPTPAVEISGDVHPDDDAVVVRIEDNGPGIPPSERELIVGARERSQLDHTSGLGLWIVNWIVSSVGGDLSFETREERGTIVTLRFPRAEAPDAEVTQ
ncbi:PAS domain-containing sensor histidine kinase [Natrarchaeobaculum aegyptiacum]|uniref:histidine kinase n=1 Tax=Natrarchaeobaculum aegyptiacum TaxID=745377 RepID=A0A2Z2I301_9EURY|nr:PAS domain S-box protein [Natrarchaeobaculum aegyptiacum]ARS91498.1 hypothetical protein B1756_18395 [Natrarchaeobaculum aegyptiacum]